MPFLGKSIFISGLVHVGALLMPTHVKRIFLQIILWRLIIILCVIFRISHLALGVFPLIISEKNAQDSISIYIPPIGFWPHPGSSLLTGILFHVLLHPMLA